jgi:hypothetical protein
MKSGRKVLPGPATHRLLIFEKEYPTEMVPFIDRILPSVVLDIYMELSGTNFQCATIALPVRY